MSATAGTPASTERPMFSFLTTAYRSEDTLPRTIESVVAQTRDDWELVVVDNGWSDAVVAAAAPYLDDPRIRLHRQENRGAAGGLAAAAELARGRCLVPLNSDDAVTPDFCARTGEVLAAHPDVAAVTCDAHQFVDPGEQPLARTYLQSAGRRGTAGTHTSLTVADIVDGPCPYYTAAIRRELWDALDGLSGDLRLVDDLDFWLRAVVAGHDVRLIPDRLGRFRIESGSVSRPSDPERIEEFEAEREEALSRAVAAAGDPAAVAALERVRRRLHYDRSMRRARLAFADGDTAVAREHLRSAWRQRRSVRVGTILLGVRLAPGLLRAVQPAKRRLYGRVDQLRRRGWRRTPRRAGGAL